MFQASDSGASSTNSEPGADQFGQFSEAVVRERSKSLLKTMQYVGTEKNVAAFKEQEAFKPTRKNKYSMVADVM